MVKQLLQQEIGQFGDKVDGRKLDRHDVMSLIASEAVSWHPRQVIRNVTKTR